MREAWESLQTHPNSDIDHFLNVMAARSNIIRPHVVLLSEGSSPISMVVGRVEELSLRLALGPTKTYAPTVRSLTVVHGGVLGLESSGVCAVLLRELMRPLERREVDSLQFNYLRVESPLYSLARAQRGILRRDRFPLISTHWHLGLPQSMEDFYASRASKHRRGWRRMERSLATDFPEVVRYVCHDDEKELDRVLRDAEYVARTTYQRGLHVGFVDSAEMRTVYSLLAKKGRLRVYLTYIQNEPKAFWIGELYRRTFTIFSTGYDPSFRKYELGTVLLLKLLEDLCELGGVETVDFGFGDAPYKQRFGDRHTQEATFSIFANNFSGLKVNVARTLILGCQRTAKRTLAALGLMEAVKRARRRNLDEPQTR